MDRRNELQVVAELALFGVTAAAVIGMDNLFEDGSFRGPLLFQAVLAHACLAAVRRTKLNLVLSSVVVVVAGVLAISWSQYADTLWVLIPSSNTWNAISADVDFARAVFDSDRPPAPVEPGFIVAISPIIWLLASIADWAAFRIRLSFEAVLPSVAAFLFAAVLSRDEGLGWGAPVYAAACLGFLLIHRTWGQETTATWASMYRRRARRTLLGTGATLAAVAVVVGTTVGPNLPGADAEAIFDWRGDEDGDDTRVVVSPLVDIRGRLVDTKDIEVFTVQSDNGGSYWRTTALDDFDGEIWGSSYNTDEVTGSLPQAVPTSTETEISTQEVSIQALGEVWLPAAFEPKAIDSDDASVVFDTASSSLLVEESSDSSDSLEYVVESAVPSWTADQLRQAGEVSGDIADDHLELPELDPAVEQEALDITEGAETQYDKAMALQNYFREFTYTLEINIRHDGDAMVQFLEERKGYCEQFSGTYAAMARSLGIPARVAVGFTQGEEDPNKEGLFRVRGEHAHAWPEVYFEGFGWVPFEPTPGRGPAGAEDWLGISEQQHGENSEAPPEPTGSEGNPTEPSPGEQPGEQPGNGQSQAPPTQAETQDSSGGAAAADAEEDSDGFFPSWVVTASIRVGLALAMYLLVVPTGLALQRYLRRQRARRPEQQVQLAWDETLEQAEELGLSIAPSMTLNERAARLHTDLPAVGSAIRHMTTVLERGLYAGTSAGPEDAAAMQQAADVVQAEVARRRSWQSRALDHLDARRLFLRRHHADRRSAHSAARSPD